MCRCRSTGPSCEFVPGLIPIFPLYSFAAYQSVHITNLNVPKTYVLDRSTYDAVGSSTPSSVVQYGGGEDDDVTTGLPMTSTTVQQLPASVSTVPSELNFTTDTGLKPLIMDCQYEIKARECGFVLKWYFNKKLIYQWIPSRTPVGMVRHNGAVQAQATYIPTVTLSL